MLGGRSLEVKFFKAFWNWFDALLFVTAFWVGLAIAKQEIFPLLLGLVPFGFYLNNRVNKYQQKIIWEQQKLISLLLEENVKLAAAKTHDDVIRVLREIKSR
jgi:hypothetical protein